jgi:hypothetical protein
MAKMADGMVEWQKWLHTYYLRYTHSNTDTDDNNDDDDTLILYSIDKVFFLIEPR